MDDNFTCKDGATAAQKHWDTVYSGYDWGNIVYDNWLANFEDRIKVCKSPIIDLGCGGGNDTKYLLERGKKVVACDRSERAIENIRKSFPEIFAAECFDMEEGFPFDDEYTEIVIADLSLHYFSQKATKDILNEIKRILKPNGILLTRLNSIRDVNYGAGQGRELEPHLFELSDGRLKRFFDSKDIEEFFADWKILHISEDQMKRYPLPKILWTLMLQADR